MEVLFLYVNCIKSFLIKKGQFILYAVSISPFCLQAQISYPQSPTVSGFQPVNVSSESKLQPSRPATTTPIVIQDEQKKQVEQRKQIELIRNELARQNKDRSHAGSKRIVIDTNEYKRNLATFENALDQLKNLAVSNVNPSLSEAFYITEKAFGNPYLTKTEYEQILNKSVSFLKQWMQENGFDVNDNEAKHIAIQRFMSERLTVGKATKRGDGRTELKTTLHLPFFYDYNDYEAKNDHRNFFVTKCLATGGGQCNSLPMVYLLLAEKLGANAYLTFAPQHSFIKYKNNKGEVENYEPTSNWHINDHWYQDNLFISPEAIRSGIYLDTLNNRKIVANCMLELAVQYIRKMPLDDGEFLTKCLREAYTYYPKQNNIYAYFIYSSYLQGLLTRHLHTHNITDFSQIENDTYAFNIQKEYQKNEQYITELGYQELPEGIYNNLIEQHEFKGAIQKSYNLTGKQIRNAFIETK